MTTTTISAPKTLSDLLPRAKGDNAKAYSIATNIVLVFAFALFTAGMAQFSIKLSFTPVPITGQTLAVLLSGAALGTYLGASSQIVYVVMGLFFPFYAEGASGWEVLKGATGGYLIGFIFAAALVGHFAERGNDRKVLSAIGAFIVGSIVIYSFGALWLAHIMDIPVFKGESSAFALGVIPFIFGDILKATVAGLALPGTWKLVGKNQQDNHQQIDITDDGYSKQNIESNSVV